MSLVPPPKPDGRSEAADASTRAADRARADAGDVLAGPFYVDTHVHIYPAFDATALLDAAIVNVRRVAPGATHEADALPVLMLTECRDDHAFTRLRDRRTLGPWRFEPLEPNRPESPALLAVREDDPNRRIALVAGRQIITVCRLEVLALGTDHVFPDGHDLDETIAEVRGRQALPVVPYGFGKWTGKRGAAVSRLIESQSLQNAPRLVLGDNGGRPTLGPRPPHFDQAAAHRVTILPGTDPLPLRSCRRQAGRFGVRVQGPIRRDAFVPELLDRLANLGPVPPRFGDHVSLPRAIYQQIALRLDRKILGGKGRL
ncbi:MAG: hypothetical protein AAGE65_12220 [Planctomycetota bacterium]